MSEPNLTFTTKIIKPLLKSKFLTSHDIVAFSSASRALMIACNVQEVQCRNLHVDITKPETVTKLEEYFEVQRFDVASSSPITTTRKSNRNSPPQSPKNNKENSNFVNATNRKRLTSWRFVSITIRGSDAAAYAFLTMLLKEYSQAAQNLRMSIQRLEFEDCFVDLSLLTSEAKALRSLILTRVSGWGLKKPFLPTLKELHLDTDDDDFVLSRGTSFQASFPKLEILQVRTPQNDHDREAWHGLSELKSISFSGGCKAILPPSFTSNKVRIFIASEQHIEDWDMLNKTMDAVIANQPNLNTMDIRNSTIDRFFTLKLAKESKNCTKLRRLDLSGCAEILDLNDVVALRGLTFLDISNCTKLCRLPDLSLLTSLVEIRMANCLKLKGVAKALSGSQSLRVIDMSANVLLVSNQVVDLLSACPLLMKLNISKCPLLIDLSDMGGNLETLIAHSCDHLQHLPKTVRAVKSITFLDVSNCTHLEELPIGLANLQCVNVSNCNRLISIARLSHAKELRALNCSATTLDGFTDVVTCCLKLEYLDCHSQSFEEFPLVRNDANGHVSPLKVIKMNDCKTLCNVSNLEVFAYTLYELELCGSAISQFASSMPVLRVLKLSGSPRLNDITDLTQRCSGLQDLDLSNCLALTSVQGLPALKSLRRLKMNECTSLRDFGWFGTESTTRLNRLEILNVPLLLDNPLVLRDVLTLDVSNRAIVVYNRNWAMGNQVYRKMEAELRLANKITMEERGGVGGGSPQNNGNNGSGSCSVMYEQNV